jgi:hypothetical protein
MTNPSPFHIPVTLARPGTLNTIFSQAGYVRKSFLKPYEHMIEFYFHGQLVEDLATQCSHCKSYYFEDECLHGCPSCHQEKYIQATEEMAYPNYG